ncbi:MAG: class I SAM-dependent methyltransferase [Acidimicrobiales bacterium]
MENISFDRASDYYDATRALPAEALDQVVSMLAAEVNRAQRCVEIGSGTGRIALPLHEAGVETLAVDLSAQMLRKLAAKRSRRPPIPVLVADARAMPLPNDVSDAVFACHVLHLIADWPRVVDEAFRVLRPRGVLLVDLGGHAEAPWDRGAMEVMAAHGVERVRPGLASIEALAAHLGDRVVARQLPAVTMTESRTLRRDLADWESQVYSWTWPYDRPQMLAVCAEVREWAAAQGLALDEPTTITRVIQWWSLRRRSEPIGAGTLAE